MRESTWQIPKHIANIFFLFINKVNRWIKESKRSFDRKKTHQNKRETKQLWSILKELTKVILGKKFVYLIENIFQHEWTQSFNFYWTPILVPPIGMASPGVFCRSVLHDLYMCKYRQLSVLKLITTCLWQKLNRTQNIFSGCWPLNKVCFEST